MSIIQTFCGAIPYVTPPPNPFGLFGGGYYEANYTDKYTYSGDTRAAGTVLGLGRYSLAACSSTANGL